MIAGTKKGDIFTMSERSRRRGIQQAEGIEKLCRHLLDRSIPESTRGDTLLSELLAMAAGMGNIRIAIVSLMAMLSEWVPGLGDASRDYMEAMHFFAEGLGERPDFEQCLAAREIGPCYELAENRDPVTGFFDIRGEGKDDDDKNVSEESHVR